MISILVIGCLSAQAAEYIYLKKPVKVYSHSTNAVLFQGERVKAVKNSKGWRISGIYKISQDGRLLHTDIKSVIPAGAVTDKKTHHKWSRSYIFSGAADASVAGNTLCQSVKDWSDLYYEKCSTCHKAYDAADYPCTRWPSIVESMKVQAGLSASERRLILRYLQLKSRDAKKR